MDSAAPTLHCGVSFIFVETKHKNADLVVHGVPLGDEHAINASALPHTPGRGREVFQCTIKLGELVDSFVTNERLPDKYNFVRVIDRDKLHIESMRPIAVIVRVAIPSPTHA